MTSTTTAHGGPIEGARPAKVLGHLALYYRPGEQQAARTLVTDLGSELVENGPRPG